MLFYQTIQKSESQDIGSLIFNEACQLLGPIKARNLLDGKSIIITEEENQRIIDKAMSWTKAAQNILTVEKIVDIAGTIVPYIITGLTVFIGLLSFMWMYGQGVQVTAGLFLATGAAYSVFGILLILLAFLLKKIIQDSLKSSALKKLENASVELNKVNVNKDKDWAERVKLLKEKIQEVIITAKKE